MNFERDLEHSISSAMERVDYVSYYISRAQTAYDSEDYAEARSSLESAIDLLKAADEDWAASKVAYYLRFM